ncbi:Six-hairpin glycosidase-like protein [Aspergillus oleicola]
MVRVWPALGVTVASCTSLANGANKTCITLTPSSPNATLDYATEVGGFPFLNIHNLTSPVQIEAKYTEAKSDLEQAYADGPWSFQNELANTFRVETFNVMDPGRIESHFQQGGQRWHVQICGVGIRSFNERRPVDELPGYFECSNELYNEIWALGARTFQQAFIAKGTAPTTRPTFLLTSEYPAASTFLNTNRTLVPPNMLIVGYGWNLVNQTSLETGKVNYYPLDFDVKEGQWLDISTKIAEKGYVVKIGNHNSMTVPLNDLQLVSNAQFSTGSVYTGTWGFGPWQDQVAYVKDVAVQAQNGSTIYHNPMTNDSILEEYGVMKNTDSVCLDGAKCDRLVWSGDFAHTQRIIAARDAAKYTSIYKGFGLLDYQMLFLNKAWMRIKAGVEVLLPLVDEYSGLATGGTSGAFFVGDGNGTAASALFAYHLNQMVELAYVVGENKTALSRTQTANRLSDAVSQRLRNAELGTYSSSLTAPNITSYIGTAWAIISGTANSTQAASAISALSSLKLGIGYKLTSDLSPSDPSTNLSPNLSGFLLEALFTYARNAPTDKAATESIFLLLNGLWSAMVNQDEYYTGTSWEYVYPDGLPGLDLFTSHSYPWGRAPTYIFPEYVLGIQPVKPGFAEWAFRPTLTHMGLSWAKGRVATPRGLSRRDGR